MQSLCVTLYSIEHYIGRTDNTFWSMMRATSRTLSHLVRCCKRALSFASTLGVWIHMENSVKCRSVNSATGTM